MIVVTYSWQLVVWQSSPQVHMLDDLPHPISGLAWPERIKIRSLAWESTELCCNCIIFCACFCIFICVFTTCAYFIIVFSTCAFLSIVLTICAYFIIVLTTCAYFVIIFSTCAYSIIVLTTCAYLIIVFTTCAYVADVLELSSVSKAATGGGRRSGLVGWT